MSISIVSAWGWATNPAYDPDTANNGGGYWQFAGGLGVDAFALVCEAREASDLCARQEVCYAD